MKSNIFYCTGLILLSTFTSCDQEHLVPNEEELITTLIYTLTPVGGGEEKVFSFRDLDGDGGMPPVLSADTLDAGTAYNGRLMLLNEAETPVENITDEVDAEGEDHQFFFLGSGVTITYDDLDRSGNPIGLETILTTGNPGLGAIRITLRHLPDKTAPFVEDGNILNAGGETDLEVEIAFEVL